ncbi:uncharacterized protein P884DRAFT_280382 [Thermothelomyces heterothallicus CBS 202.75]|uniref:uncharacterized protein n=1 Tax=Thermothelomyces heterothallicus CBS 202.75 TaxID=1149848 RepID=UPI003742A8B5
MDDIPVSDYEIQSLRDAKGILSQREIDLILELSVAGQVANLDGMLGDIASQHGTTMGVLLVHARDAENRNAVHYAAMGQSIESLNYLLDSRLFPQQPALRLALLHTRTRTGENAAIYAIRQRCSVAFLDRIIAAGTPCILDTLTADGLGPVHCAAMEDAREMIIHLVKKHCLDPNQPFTPPANRLLNSDDDDDDDDDGNSKNSNGEQHHTATGAGAGQLVEGDTPLHLAARRDSAAAFEALHSALGCNIWTARNAAGQSAIDVACSALASGVLAYLGRKRGMSDVNRGDKKRKRQKQNQQQQQQEEEEEEQVEGIELDEVDDEADFFLESLDVFGQKHPANGCGLRGW